MINPKPLEDVVMVQGMKVALELWKVLEEDPRWWGVDGELAPTRFNPDRCAHASTILNPDRCAHASIRFNPDRCAHASIKQYIGCHVCSLTFTTCLSAVCDPVYSTNFKYVRSTK